MWRNIGQTLVAFYASELRTFLNNAQRRAVSLRPTDELLVIHQRLTTEFDDDFLALQQDDGCGQRSRTVYRPARPARIQSRSARPYCRRLALSAHYDSAIRRAVAVLCSQRTSDEINEAI